MPKRRVRPSPSVWERLQALLAAHRREAVGVALATAGALAFISLLAESRLLFLFVGVGAWPLALALVIGGALTIVWPRLNLPPPWAALAGLEIAYFALVGLAHLLGAGPDPVAAAEAGRGGGVVGYGLSRLLSSLGGKWLAGAIFVIIALTGLGLTVRWFLWLLGWEFDWRAFLAGAADALLPASASGSQPARRTPPMVPSQTGARIHPAKQPTLTPLVIRPSRKPPVAKPKTVRLPPRDRSLPPLDLLGTDPTPSGGQQEDVAVRARIIEDTLQAFGVPGRVVDTHVGPTVTQFGVEPGLMERRGPDGQLIQTRVRVGRIASLANDLALALAASPIRIEAPVPGRPYVGIEVPNGRTSLVTLRPVLESSAFRSLRSPLALALGRGVDGEPVATDLARMPHLLIAGATGSGKSVCINALITCLLCNNPPERLKLLLVDPKRVELVNFNGIPHLLAPVIVELDQVVAALTWVTQQMDERYHLFAATGVRNLEAYNRRKGTTEPLPYIVVIVDELADLMMLAPDEVERRICRLAQMARATGIHLIIATQRPSVDVVTGLIKANFPARIAFAVASQIDSRVILDSPGAERLLGRGDMLFMAPESNKLQRLQGCYVSDREITAVADFWRAAVDEPPVTVPPWADLLDEIEARANGDALLAQAIAVIRGRRRVSASLLQRQLRIGYPRAARLMDLLEERGYVGPDEGGGRSRAVLIGGDEIGEEGFGEEEGA